MHSICNKTVNVTYQHLYICSTVSTENYANLQGPFSRTQQPSNCLRMLSEFLTQTEANYKLKELWTHLQSNSRNSFGIKYRACIDLAILPELDHPVASTELVNGNHDLLASLLTTYQALGRVAPGTILNAIVQLCINILFRRNGFLHLFTPVSDGLVEDQFRVRMCFSCQHAVSTPTSAVEVS